MFPQYDKGIYIDSDIVVPGDISELYNIDLEENIIGGCADSSIIGVPEFAEYVEQAVGVSKYNYINSGVLLMNLKKMREKQFSKKFLGLLNTYHFDCVAPDQDYINAMCNGKIHYLHETWDVMPNDINKVIENPKIVHYNLFQKPWCYDNVQYENYFWEYAKDSKYYNTVVEMKNNYTQENRQADMECLAKLVGKADKVPSQEVTFKKVFEAGGKIQI